MGFFVYFSLLHLFIVGFSVARSLHFVVIAVVFAAVHVIVHASFCTERGVFLGGVDSCPRRAVLVERLARRLRLRGDAACERVPAAGTPDFANLWGATLDLGVVQARLKLLQSREASYRHKGARVSL